MLTPPVDVPGPRIPHLSMFRYMREPMAFLRDCALKYGDPFLIHVFGRWVVNMADPEGARAVTMVTPVANMPSVLRKWRESKSGGSRVGRGCTLNLEGKGGLLSEA